MWHTRCGFYDRIVKKRKKEEEKIKTVVLMIRKRNIMDMRKIRMVKKGRENTAGGYCSGILFLRLLRKRDTCSILSLYLPLPLVQPTGLCSSVNTLH